MGRGGAQRGLARTDDPLVALEAVLRRDVEDVLEVGQAAEHARQPHRFPRAHAHARLQRGRSQHKDPRVAEVVAVAERHGPTHTTNAIYRGRSGCTLRA
jgi:hypothetical protein